MMKVISIIFIFLLGLGSLTAAASERERINLIGSSSKGQFVAFEEYSYVPVRRAYQVSIRIMNVWTKEFVGQKISIEVPATKPNTLQGIRERARFMAKDELSKFKIST